MDEKIAMTKERLMERNIMLYNMGGITYAKAAETMADIIIQQTNRINDFFLRFDDAIRILKELVQNSRADKYPRYSGKFKNFIEDIANCKNIENKIICQAFREILDFMTEDIEDISNFDFPMCNTAKFSLVSYCYNSRRYNFKSVDNDVHILKCIYDKYKTMPPYEALPFLSLIYSLSTVNDLVTLMNILVNTGAL